MTARITGKVGFFKKFNKHHDGEEKIWEHRKIHTKINLTYGCPKLFINFFATKLSFINNKGKQRDDHLSRERGRKKRKGKEYRLGEKIVNKTYV